MDIGFTLESTSQKYVYLRIIDSINFGNFKKFSKILKID